MLRAFAAAVLGMSMTAGALANDCKTTDLGQGVLAVWCSSGKTAEWASAYLKANPNRRILSFNCNGLTSMSCTAITELRVP